MPTYSYRCSKCNNHFEVFFYFKDYIPNPKCACGSNKTERDYEYDLGTVRGSVKKSDSELKTIGDLANRNRDRLSDDRKTELYHKHNEYKETESTKELPKGMNRIKKPKTKFRWT